MDLQISNLTWAPPAPSPAPASSAPLPLRHATSLYSSKSLRPLSATGVRNTLPIVRPGPPALAPTLSISSIKKPPPSAPSLSPSNQKQQQRPISRASSLSPSQSPSIPSSPPQNDVQESSNTIRLSRPNSASRQRPPAPTIPTLRIQPVTFSQAPSSARRQSSSRPSSSRPSSRNSSVPSTHRASSSMSTARSESFLSFGGSFGPFRAPAAINQISVTVTVPLDENAPQQNSGSLLFDAAAPSAAQYKASVSTNVYRSSPLPHKLKGHLGPLGSGMDRIECDEYLRDIDSETSEVEDGGDSSDDDGGQLQQHNSRGRSRRRASPIYDAEGRLLVSIKHTIERVPSPSPTPSPIPSSSHSSSSSSATSSSLLASHSSLSDFSSSSASSPSISPSPSSSSASASRMNPARSWHSVNFPSQDQAQLPGNNNAPSQPESQQNLSAVNGNRSRSSSPTKDHSIKLQNMSFDSSFAVPSASNENSSSSSNHAAIIPSLPSLPSMLMMPSNPSTARLPSSRLSTARSFNLSLDGSKMERKQYIPSSSSPSPGSRSKSPLIATSPNTKRAKTPSSVAASPSPPSPPLSSPTKLAVNFPSFPARRGPAFSHSSQLSPSHFAAELVGNSSNKYADALGLTTSPKNKKGSPNSRPGSSLSSTLGVGSVYQHQMAVEQHILEQRQQQQQHQKEQLYKSFTLSRSRSHSSIPSSSSSSTRQQQVIPNDDGNNDDRTHRSSSWDVDEEVMRMLAIHSKLADRDLNDEQQPGSFYGTKSRSPSPPLGNRSGSPNGEYHYRSGSPSVFANSSLFAPPQGTLSHSIIPTPPPLIPELFPRASSPANPLNAYPFSIISRSVSSLGGSRNQSSTLPRSPSVNSNLAKARSMSNSVATTRRSPSSFDNMNSSSGAAAQDESNSSNGDGSVRAGQSNLYYWGVVKTR